MTRHTFDITVTGPGAENVRLIQAVETESLPKAIIMACELVVQSGVADSATHLVIERREA